MRCVTFVLKPFFHNDTRYSVCKTHSNGSQIILNTPYILVLQNQEWWGARIVPSDLYIPKTFKISFVNTILVFSLYVFTHQIFTFLFKLDWGRDGRGQKPVDTFLVSQHKDVENILVAYRMGSFLRTKHCHQGAESPWESLQKLQKNNQDFRPLLSVRWLVWFLRDPSGVIWVKQSCDFVSRV